jgi:thymidylate synthase (FAD)
MGEFMKIEIDDPHNELGLRSEYNNSIELYGDGIGRVDYIDHMGSDLTIVNSARVSFGVHKDELDTRDKKLIAYLIKHRHTSTLEHCSATFKFTVPLFVRSQHHRHRTWSYNEISRRYTEKGLAFYEPTHFRTQHKSNRQASNIEDRINPVIVPDLSDSSEGTRADHAIRLHNEQSIRLFHRLMVEGVCREQARSVLPQSLYTEYYGTVNLSNLLKFIDLRTHEGAQWEIQEVAKACLEIATDLWPTAVNTYRRIRCGGTEV